MQRSFSDSCVRMLKSADDVTASVGSRTTSAGISSKGTLEDLYAEIAERNSSTDLVADRRLANWELWMKTRNLCHRRFIDKLDRDPKAFCMNSIEELRSIKEEKQILEYSRIIEITNPYRFALKYPAPLLNRGKPDLPVCTRQMLGPDEGIIPTIEFVGIPAYIKREKGIVGQNDRRTPRQLWDSNQYVKQAMHDRAYEVNRVTRHIPQTENLIVIGNEAQERINHRRGAILCRMTSKPDGSQCSREIPTLTVTDYDEEMSKATAFSVGAAAAPKHSDHYICLQVNDTKLEWGTFRGALEQTMRKCESVFCYDTDVVYQFPLLFIGTVSETRITTLRLENLGNVKITYAWRKHSRDYNNFPKIHTTDQSPFYFNKNDGMLLPGQIVEFPFWFRSATQGIFAETWILSTQPPMFVEGLCINVLLWACVQNPDKRDNLELSRVDEYLHQCSVNSNVAEHIDVVLRRAMPDYCPNKARESEDFAPDFIRRVSHLYGRPPPDPRAWEAKLEAQYHITTRQLKKHELAYQILCNCFDAIQTEAERFKRLYGITEMICNNLGPATSSEECDLLMYNYLRNKLRSHGNKNGTADEDTDDARHDGPRDDPVKLISSRDSLQNHTSNITESVQVKPKLSMKARLADREMKLRHAKAADLERLHEQLNEAAPLTSSDHAVISHAADPTNVDPASSQSALHDGTQFGFDVKSSDSLILHASKMFHRDSMTVTPSVDVKKTPTALQISADARVNEETDNTFPRIKSQVSISEPIRREMYLARLRGMVHARLCEAVDQLALYIDAVNTLSDDDAVLKITVSQP